MIRIDEARGVAALNVVPARFVRTETEVGEANCWWDYQVDHFVDRFAGHVPYEVLLELREALGRMAWSARGKTCVA